MRGRGEEEEQQHILLSRKSVFNTITRAEVIDDYAGSAAQQGNNAEWLEQIEHGTFIVLDIQSLLS